MKRSVVCVVGFFGVLGLTACGGGPSDGSTGESSATTESTGEALAAGPGYWYYVCGANQWVGYWSAPLYDYPDSVGLWWDIDANEPNGRWLYVWGVTQGPGGPFAHAGDRYGNSGYMPLNYLCPH
jgi:hypothetical protein